MDKSKVCEFFLDLLVFHVIFNKYFINTEPRTCVRVFKIVHPPLRYFAKSSDIPNSADPRLPQTIYFFSQRFKSDGLVKSIFILIRIDTYVSFRRTE